MMENLIARTQVMRQKKPARWIVLMNTFVVPVDNAFIDLGDAMDLLIAKTEVMRPLMFVVRTAAV